MEEKIDFFNWAYKDFGLKNFTTDESKSFNNDLYNHIMSLLNFFPNFPDFDLITNLSCENYEKKKCDAKLVFLPYGIPNNLPISFASNELLFEHKNIRLLRKVLASIDSNHYLVLAYDNENYYIKGIANKSFFDSELKDYYLISISGYLNWSAECKNIILFDYINGIFCKYNHVINKNKEQIKKIELTANLVKFPENIDCFKKMLEIILEQNHGTCFVIFNSSKIAKKQAKRLCNAKRGIMLEKKLTCDDVLLTSLPQLTNIDGGLIFDNNMNCYAYGCIFDGKIKDNFEGALERGSRYNSTKLYVAGFNKNSISCLGIISSDDGGIEIIPNCEIGE